MKKLLLSINPEFYRRYKGAQKNLDALAIEIAKFNSGLYIHETAEAFISFTQKSIDGDIELWRTPEATYEILRCKRRGVDRVKYGEIIKINLL